MDALALTVSLHSLTILGMRSPRVVHIFITCFQVDISSWLLEKIICWGCRQRSLWVNSMWSGKVDQNKSWASSCHHPLELGRDSVVQLAGGVILHVYACASLSRAYTDHRGVLLQSLSPAGCPSALSWSPRNSVLCCKLKPTLFPDFENFLTAVCLSSCLLAPSSKSRTQRNQK